MYSNRPKLKISPTKTDTIVERVSIIFLLIHWAFTIYALLTVPDTIPTHFNWKMKADNFGSKWTLLLFPLITTAFYAGLSLMNRYPHLFNYIDTITEENAYYRYSRAVRVMRFTKLFLIIFLLYVDLLVYVSVKGFSVNAAFILIPTVLITLITPIAAIPYFFKNKNKP